MGAPCVPLGAKTGWPINALGRTVMSNLGLEQTFLQARGCGSSGTRVGDRMSLERIAWKAGSILGVEQSEHIVMGLTTLTTATGADAGLNSSRRDPVRKKDVFELAETGFEGPLPQRLRTWRFSAVKCRFEGRRRFQGAIRAGRSWNAGQGVCFIPQIRNEAAGFVFMRA